MSFPDNKLHICQKEIIFIIVVKDKYRVVIYL